MDTLIKWAIYVAIAAAAVASVVWAWGHYVLEPARDEGRQEVRLELQPQIDALTNQVKVAKVVNEGFARDLKQVQETVSRYAAEALAWQDKARLAKEAAARDKAAFAVERDKLQAIIDRPKSNEQCESICARANALLGDLINSSVLN